MDNNVIPFPKKNLSAIPSDMDEINEKIVHLRQHHVNETLANVIPAIFNMLESAGFSFDEDPGIIEDMSLKDGAFLIESIKSMLYRHHGMSHPFQTISENVFDLTFVEENPTLTIVEELVLDLKASDKK